MTYEGAISLCQTLAAASVQFPRVEKLFNAAAGSIVYAKESAERSPDSKINNNGRQALSNALSKLWDVGHILHGINMDPPQRIELIAFLNRAINSPEVNVEVDGADKVIGLRPRDDFYDGSCIHRSSHLILKNSEGFMLLQQRAFDKKWYPGLFTFAVSGTVGTESYEEAIVRETAEEIGLKIKEPVLAFKYLCMDDNMKSWSAIFVVETDETPVVDEREAESSTWMSEEAIKSKFVTEPDIFTPPFIQGMTQYFNRETADSLI